MDMKGFWTRKLLMLVESSAEVQDMAMGREEARKIGEEINELGGLDMMREVAHLARDIGKAEGQHHALGYIERWWNGIGRWR